MINNILTQCSAFYKQASMIAVPPIMLKQLQDLAKKYFSAAVLFELSDKHPKSKDQIVEVGLIKQECKKYTNEEINYISYDTIVREINLNLEGWKYLTEKVKRLHEKLPYDGLRVRFSFLKSAASGYYNRESTTLTVFFADPKTVNSVSYFKQLLKFHDETIEHELQHFAQYFLTDTIDLDKGQVGNLFGLPKKDIRTKEYHYSGMPLQEIEKSESEPRFSDFDSRIDHKLRDIEFFTNINDSVSEFKNFIEKEPHFKNELAKMWVGLPNSYFKLQSQHIKNNATKNNLDYYLYQLETNYYTREPFKTLKSQDSEKYKQSVKVFWQNIKDLI